MASVASILAEIDDCILALLQGKAAVRQFQGRSYTYLDLDKLRKLREHYQSLSNSSAIAGGVRPFKMFGIRMREAP